jgi:NADH dehydrogenase subunit 5 C-terminus
MDLGKKILKNLDQGWFEVFGTQYFFSYFQKLSNTNQIIQFNNFKIYFVIFSF